jgi:hypothetical protein
MSRKKQVSPAQQKRLDKITQFWEDYLDDKIFLKPEPDPNAPPKKNINPIKVGKKEKRKRYGFGS